MLCFVTDDNNGLDSFLKKKNDHFKKKSFHSQKCQLTVSSNHHLLGEIIGKARSLINQSQGISAGADPIMHGIEQQQPKRRDNNNEKIFLTIKKLNQLIFQEVYYLATTHSGTICCCCAHPSTSLQIPLEFASIEKVKQKRQLPSTFCAIVGQPRPTKTKPDCIPQSLICRPWLD